MKKIKAFGFVLFIITGIVFVGCKNPSGPNVTFDEVIGLWLWEFVTATSKTTVSGYDYEIDSTSGQYDSVPFEFTDTFDTSAAAPENSTIEFSSDSSFTVQQNGSFMQSINAAPLPNSGRWWISNGRIQVEYQDGGGMDTSTVIAGVEGDRAVLSYITNDSNISSSESFFRTTTTSITAKRGGN